MIEARESQLTSRHRYLKTLEPTPALEREADAIDARLAEIRLATV